MEIMSNSCQVAYILMRAGSIYWTDVVYLQYFQKAVVRIPSSNFSHCHTKKMTSILFHVRLCMSLKQNSFTGLGGAYLHLAFVAESSSNTYVLSAYRNL